MRVFYPLKGLKTLGFSLLLLMLTTAAYSQYCPGYTSNPCSSAGFIRGVTLSNIDNQNNLCDKDMTGFDDGYSDYTDQLIFLAPGSTNMLTLNITNPLYATTASVWIDWNQNKVWDQTELIPVVGNADVGVFTALITVPDTAVLDSIGHLRIVMDWLVPVVEACDAASIQGEVEDYAFIVTDSVPTTTPGSPSTYCPPLVGNECTESAIKRFAVADLDNDNNVCDREINTTGVADGYSDYTDMIVTFNPTTPYPVTVEIYGSLIFDAAAVWVDWNVDGSWTDEEYYPLVGNGYAVNVFTGAIVPPPGAVTGKIGRIRVIGDFTLTPTDPCVETFAGEIEDYSFILLPSDEEIPDCVDMTKVSPQDSSSNNCQHTTLRWPKVANASGYKLTLRDTTDNVFITSELALTDTFYTVPAILTPGHTYRWIPMAMNGDIAGFMCDSAIFTTSANDDPTASILGGTDSISTCFGAPVQLDGGPANGTLPYTHNWSGSFASKLSSTTIVNPSAKSDSVGVFTYFYTVTDNNQCKATDSVNVYVKKLPNPGILSADKAGYCPGDTATITLTGNEGKLYILQDSTVSGWATMNATKVNDSTYVADQTTTTTLVRAIVQLDGCIDTTNVATINYYDIYLFAAISNSGRDSICIGEKTTLVSAISGYHKWNTGSTADSLLVSAPGTFTLTVTDTNMCVTQASYTVYPNVEATKPTIIPSSAAPYCVGEWVTLTATGTSIFWKDSTGAYSIADSVSTTKNGTFQARTTNPEGCSATSNPYTVSFNALPAKPTITQLGTRQCVGDSVGLKTNAVYPQWNTGESTKTIYVFTDGQYTVTDTSAFGCANTSDTFNLVFDPLPDSPTISQQGNQLVSDSTGVKYRWFNSSNVQVAVTTTASWKPTKSGIYYVVVENSEGCSSAPSSPAPFNGLGVTELDTPDQWVIYPNPAGSSVNIATPIAGTAVLYDALGKEINSWKLSAGENKISLDLASGVYLIRLGNTVQRLTIQ